MDGGCIDCKFFKSNLGEKVCLFGNQDKMIDWWANNSNKKRSQNNFDAMECFEKSEHLATLEFFMSLAENIKSNLYEKP